VIKVLGSIGLDGRIVEPMTRTKLAETFDERNHRWVIECRGNFEEAMRLTQDFLAVLYQKFQILGYRVLVEDNDLLLENPSATSRFLNRIDSLENSMRTSIAILKQSRRVIGNKMFQSIREELETALRGDPHGWQPPCSTSEICFVSKKVIEPMAKPLHDAFHGVMKRDDAVRITFKELSDLRAIEKIHSALAVRFMAGRDFGILTQATYTSQLPEGTTVTLISREYIPNIESLVDILAPYVTNVECLYK
jgi:hypothetical protein